MSEHLKLDCLLIEPITEPDSILLGITSGVSGILTLLFPYMYISPKE